MNCMFRGNEEVYHLHLGVKGLEDIKKQFPKLLCVGWTLPPGTLCVPRTLPWLRIVFVHCNALVSLFAWVASELSARYDITVYGNFPLLFMNTCSGEGVLR
ncbi:hypothetical protein, unlikely [Trypanosoma brucei gambiense DAL972]|uniref:Uncharacterized protein n=1 Tax=Trypanosoma brucei gambiense (strain MHOM/CI/86/DAL972) TaxID=679716 RepID=D0A016_TRYB9|nr:hypothetical protein, unlikely [Trypanosoma brucei gambiense DAL972]CBH16574.1 hypothetical protein, unlikely [Trypanosoma brucei gambiense DAL972]|eukprot:XP_011778838.1 hypothetical protein, unlikely [Trypanosoma brucei gambiense DAL972]